MNAEELSEVKSEASIATEEVFSPYMSEEVELKKRTPFHAMWLIFKIRAWKVLGHHPACSRYENHYFKIGSFIFCIGCTSIYSAILLYLILFLAVPSVFRYNIYVICILPFAGFGLSISHLFLRVKNKWLKSIFRFSAGFGIGAFGAIIVAVFKYYWWLSIILSMLLLAGNQLYGMSRGHNANRQECIDCPLANSDPPCEPIRNTNIRIRKVHEIVDEELQKAQKQAQTKGKKTT